MLQWKHIPALEMHKDKINNTYRVTICGEREANHASTCLLMHRKLPEGGWETLSSGSLPLGDGKEVSYPLVLSELAKSRLAYK